MLNDIKDGLEKKEFYLEFMPTIRLSDETCVGAESLIRWRRKGKIIPPLDFIPQIENTPLAGVLTYWIIEEIGRELGKWLHENNDVHIGINVPPEIIGRGGIAQAVKNAGLTNVLKKLIIEITERGIPDELAIEAMGLAKGVRCAVDDFGTGDLNLLQLSKINVDVIKIDKAFVDQIQDQQWMPRMIKGLTAFARALETEIIAEGVETQVQVSTLKELNVDMAQGYFYSKPLGTRDFIEFYNKTK
jgi:sensor c-di-GMP phosphodiesterase-like protein